MRKVLIALAVTLVAASSAHAAEFQAFVVSIDLDARSITFDDGQTLTAADDVDISTIEENDPVIVTTDDSTNEITEILLGE